MLLAAGAGAHGSGTLLALAVLGLLAAVALSPFRRRIGGKGGGSEKASVGAWWLLVAIVLGLLVAGR